MAIRPGGIGRLDQTYVVTPPSVWVPTGTSVVDGTTVEVVSVTVIVVAGKVYVPAARSASALDRLSSPPRVVYSPGVGTVWPIGVGTTAGVSATGEVAAELVGVTASEGGVMTALLVALAGGALGVGCPVFIELVSRNKS